MVQGDGDQRRCQVAITYCNHNPRCSPWISSQSKTPTTEWHLAELILLLPIPFSAGHSKITRVYFLHHISRSRSRLTTVPDNCPIHQAPSLYQPWFTPPLRSSQSLFLNQHSSLRPLSTPSRAAVISTCPLSLNVVQKFYLSGLRLRISFHASQSRQ